MSTCNPSLDLQTLGSQPVMMPKILPDHWLCPKISLITGYVKNPELIFTERGYFHAFCGSW